MENLAVATKPEVDLLGGSRSMIEQAAIILAGAGLDKSVAINNDVENQDRSNKLTQIKSMERDLEAERKRLVGPYNQTVKLINEAFKSPIERLSSAGKKYEAAILDYRRKKEMEARAAAEKLRREQEEAKRREEERIRKEAEKAAAKLEKRGNEEAAAEVRAQAEAVVAEVAAIPVTVIAPEAPKNVRTDDGTVFTKKDTEVEVIDLKALLAAIVAGTVPVGVVEVKLPELKRLAKMGVALPGCTVREVEKIQTRGGR